MSFRRNGMLIGRIRAARFLESTQKMRIFLTLGLLVFLRIISFHCPSFSVAFRCQPCRSNRICVWLARSSKTTSWLSVHDLHVLLRMLSFISSTKKTNAYARFIRLCTVWKGPTTVEKISTALASHVKPIGFQVGL